jgi:hypothetical protein
VIWNGDVWKAVVALRAQLSQHIDIAVGDFDYGVGVIRLRPGQAGIAPTIRPLFSFLSGLSAEQVIGALQYELLNEHRAELLNLKSVVELREWLD